MRRERESGEGETKGGKNSHEEGGVLVSSLAFIAINELRNEVWAEQG